MYIHKIHLQDSKVFGCKNIELAPYNNFKAPENAGSEIWLNDSSHNYNTYTYLIGDNGVGKTSLMNIIAKRRINNSELAFRSKDDKVIQPTIKFVGPGLDLSNMEDEDRLLMTTDPSRLNVNLQFLLFFLECKDNVKALESKIKKEFSPKIKIMPSWVKVKTQNGDAFKAWTYNRIKSWDFYTLLYKDYHMEDKELADKLSLLSSYQYFIKNYNIDDLGYDSVRFLVKQLEIFSGCISNSNNINSVYSIVSKHTIELNLEEKDIDIILPVVLLFAEAGFLKIEVDVIEDCNVIPLNSLSTGEKMIIKLFSYLSCLGESDKEKLIFLCDEPENSLHPKWQLEFPNQLKDIVENIYKVKKSHFIIATHSPLIIMRAYSLPHTYIVHCYKDTEGFTSDYVKDIQQFSIEKLLMNEFDMIYSDLETEKKLYELMNSNKQRFIDLKNNPYDTVQKIFELKEEIDTLYKTVVGNNEVH